VAFEVYARVIAAAREWLTFLEQRPGCRVEEESNSMLTRTAYVLDDLTFEVHLDWRDYYATLMVGRTMGGRCPPGYLIHFGLRVRYHLHDLLPGPPEASGPPAAVAANRRRKRAKTKVTATTMDRADRMVEAITVMAAALPSPSTRYAPRPAVATRRRTSTAGSTHHPCRRTRAPDSSHC
jgi:hypothetical protein